MDVPKLREAYDGLSVAPFWQTVGEPNGGLVDHEGFTIPIDGKVADFIVLAHAYMEQLLRLAERYGTMDTLAISWHIDDVKVVNSGLTDDQARKVLATMGKYHDAEVGICWDTIEATIESLYPHVLPLEEELIIGL